MSSTISELSQLWDRVLLKIHDRINDQRVYDSFFDKTYVDSLNGSTMIVVANSSLAPIIIRSRYQDIVDRCVQEVTGTNFTIEFVEKSEVKKLQEERKEKPSFFADSHLDPKFTFESFVVGDSNREAYQAALMISKNPGKLFNPLLLYSDSGLGKTHLMQSIGNALREEKPTAKVLYIAAADFVDEYIKFTQGYKEEQTLAQYFKTEVDCLLIDDIQFLIGKKKTMEMFFVVFADLEKAGKQIVITSDQHPNLLEGLDDRLKSRFQAGLVLSIKRPDLATSAEILRTKITASGLDVNDFDEDVISFLATRFSNNVRELEGALTRLLFYTINMKPTKHITIEVAVEAIQGLVAAQDDRTNLSEGRIVAVVADYYNLTPSQLTGKIRTSQIALARHIAMYLMKMMMQLPFTKIGQYFGGRDHATAMKGVEKVEKSLKLDADLRKAIDDLKTKLTK
ncbi:MAG: chromosomal replication initiator protein DnaA [Bacilli bacterium]|nr:chromosomal replication initiator protein DnaA [Bacilli bacterium]MBO6286545.1 chromosomal replication initiator protein DnaA [Bacilli bacterium]